MVDLIDRMEVDLCEDAGNSGDSPSELKTKKSIGGGDPNTKLCNGDAKRVNGQNGSHEDEEDIETSDLNGSSNENESKDGEETDSKSSHSRQKDNDEIKQCDTGGESESSGGDSIVQANGTDPIGSDKDIEAKDIQSVNDEDSKSSADDNKENESIKSEVDDSSQDKITTKSDKDESTPASPSPPSTEKKPTLAGIDRDSVELELEKELKKPSAEELQRAAEVDQREKKLKRIEDAAKDNDDLRPVAKLLYGIGMDLGAQHIYKDLVRAQNKKHSMNKLDKRGREQLTKLKDTYKKLNKRNQAYQLKMRSCDKCGFKTESKNVIEWHLEFAHGQDEGKYECSFCDFETRLPAPFFFHMEAEHNRKGRVFMKKAFFSCPQCPYENNSKNAVARHRLKCDKQFGLKRNQEPLPTDCDIPLKKPKSIITKRVQPASKPPATANIQLKSYLDTRGPQQGSNVRPMTSVVRVNPSNPTVQTILSQQQARTQITTQSVMQNQRGRIMAQPAVRPNAQQIQGPGGQMYTLVNPPLMVQQVPSAYTTILPQVRPTQGQGLQFVQQQQQQQTPQNISQIAQQVVAQVTQQHSAAQQQKAIQDILKRAQVPPASAASSNQRPGMAMTDAQAQAAAASNPKFEICEICGGFVKDRESLRIHFYWAHKVDIQKDVFARLNPHLKCDSCPQAFWTYQGLARHRQISHVKPRERSYRCYLCGAKNIENIITHLSAAHNVKLNTMYKTGKCLVCGLGFAGEKGLKRHIHTAHLELLKGTPEIGMGPSKSQLTTPSQSPKSNPPLKAPTNKGTAPVPTGLFENSAKKKKFEPVCSLCNIVFPSVESFTMHCNKLHVFKCWRCSDKWASADLLHKHWNEKHKHEVDQCVLCPDRVTIGRPMVRHMKRSHLKQCSVVLVGMKKDQVKFYMDRLEELEKKAKKDPPSGAEVIVLESDDEDLEDAKKEKPTASSSGQESKGDINKSNCDTSDTASSDAVLKSGDHEVLEIDGEKIVVQVNADDDEESDAQSKVEKEESRELNS